MGYASDWLPNIKLVFRPLLGVEKQGGRVGSLNNGLLTLTMTCRKNYFSKFLSYISKRSFTKQNSNIGDCLLIFFKEGLKRVLLVFVI